MQMIRVVFASKLVVTEKDTIVLRKGKVWHLTRTAARLGSRAAIDNS